MIIFLIALGFISLVGGIFFWAHQKEKQRREEFRQVARTMGFEYTEKLEGDAGETWGPLPLFSRGHGRAASSLMKGEVAGEPVVLCDYRYTVQSGKNSQVYIQSVALFLARGRDLPDFEVGPENVFHRIGQVFGYQDIDFEQDDEFSKRCLLRGEDESAIRRAFTPTVRSLLVQDPKWCMESRGDVVAIYRTGKRSKPEEAPAFLADALRRVSGLGR